mgnify:CR=1 FL=1
MATKEEMILAVRAVKNRLVDQARVQECLDIQKNLASQGKEIGLMEVLMKKGYLTARQMVYIKTGDGVGLDLASENDRKIVPGYLVDRKLGQGGMATVYQARQIANGQICALKVLFPHHSGNENLVDGFLNEGQLLKKLCHENIVRGFDTGHAKEFYYVALEYVDGVTVQEVLDKKGALTEELALEIILQVSRALRYLATQNITHRDIKPGNMLIDREGVIKLCDLGFAKTSGGSGGESDVTCGTVEYISPEQAYGRADVDVRSDIYSLGATLYHLVVGEVPFSGSDGVEVMAKQIREGLSSEKVKSRDISRHMHYFLEKMMAKEREVRYEHPDEMIADIEETVAGNRSLQFDPYGNQVKNPLDEIAEFFQEHGEPTVEESLSKRRAKPPSARLKQQPPASGRRRPSSGLGKDETRGAADRAREPGSPPKKVERRPNAVDKFLGRRPRDK